MSAFALDTSGVVYTEITLDYGQATTIFPLRWSDLSPFEQGYTRKALEDLIARIQSGQIAPLDGVRRWPGFSDLAPETLAAIRKDCAAISALIPGLDARDGQDIWTGRQKGFPGSGTVTEYMRAHFPPLTITLSDDGKVVFGA